MCHPQIGRFDERASRASYLLWKGLEPLPLPLFPMPFLHLLVADICTDDVLIQSDGADALCSRPKTSRCLRIADWPLSLSTVLATLYYGGLLKHRSYKARKIGAGDHHAQSHLYRVQRNKRARDMLMSPFTPWFWEVSPLQLCAVFVIIMVKYPLLEWA
jgi:hypothetical protein